MNNLKASLFFPVSKCDDNFCQRRQAASTESVLIDLEWLFIILESFHIRRCLVGRGWRRECVPPRGPDQSIRTLRMSSCNSPCGPFFPHHSAILPLGGAPSTLSPTMSSLDSSLVWEELLFPESGEERECKIVTRRKGQDVPAPGQVTEHLPGLSGTEPGAVSDPGHLWALVVLAPGERALPPAPASHSIPVVSHPFCPMVTFRSWEAAHSAGLSALRPPCSPSVGCGVITRATRGKRAAHIYQVFGNIMYQERECWCLTHRSQTAF